MQFHILSFEGPDSYAQAGGIATRVSGLAQALADTRLETHLWFVGDPDLSGHERRDALQLHRWGQWISRYHSAGVYDGEEGDPPQGGETRWAIRRRRESGALRLVLDSGA